MSEQASQPVRRPRINPFAFPSETTLRFVLLVIFVLCGSAGFYGDFRGTQNQAAEECAAQVIPKLLKLMSSSAGNDVRALFADVEVHFLSLAGCAALLRPQALWHLGGMALVIVVTAIIYYLYPSWKLKIGRLEPIGSSEFPELAQELLSITQTARLRYPIVFVWNPVASGLPVVFGRYSKHYVALSGWFISQYFYGDRKSFRAIMLHELAHIHNGDIYKTYVTISLWLAFIATSLTPAAVIFLWRLTTLRWWEAAPLLLNGILWTAIVTLSGLAVLRSREYYADVQASVWDQRSQIDRVLAALPVPVGKAWRHCLWSHPDPRERRQIVDDPSRLLRLSFADAFGIGIAAWLVVGVVTGVLLPFMPSHPWAAIAFTGSIIFVVPAFVFILAIGALGIGVWRSAFASLLKGDLASRGTGWLAVAFVAGAFPALALSLIEAVLQSFGQQSTQVGFMLAGPLVKAMTYCVLLAGCLLIFRWISQTTSAWFEVVLQSRSPRWVLLFSVATALILVVMTLGIGLNAAMRIAISVPENGLSWIGASGTTVPIFIVSLAVWVVPLTATLRRKQIASPELAGWVFLDHASPKIPEQEPVYPSQALSIGFAMGLIHLLFWQLLHFSNYFPAEIANGIHSAFRWLWAWTESVFGEKRFLHVGSAAGLQALAAAIAATRARRLSVVFGLFAASVAGFVIVIGEHVSSPNNYDFPAWVNASVAIAKMGEGAVVALPTAIIVAWLANVSRRLCESKLVSRKFDADPKETWRAVRWSALLRLSFVTLFIVVGFGTSMRMREVQEVNAYRAAGERGNGDAQNKLGYMYARGLSVARNDVYAVRWWRKAAERGHADAQYNLARMLVLGRGVERNEIIAVQWIRQAAEQGHADAQNELGICYGLGRGTPRDDAAAVEWFRKAAERGHADAQYNLGMMYQEGRALSR